MLALIDKQALAPGSKERFIREGLQNRLQQLNPELILQEHGHSVKQMSVFEWLMAQVKASSLVYNTWWSHSVSLNQNERIALVREMLASGCVSVVLCTQPQELRDFEEQTNTSYGYFDLAFTYDQVDKAEDAIAEQISHYRAFVLQRAAYQTITRSFPLPELE